MAPRKKRLRFGQLGRLILLSQDDWKAIQNASGIYFKKPEFVRLTLANMALSYVGGIEASAPSKEALNKIRRLAKLVASLRKEFPSADTDQFWTEFSEILRYATRTEEQWSATRPAFLLETFSHVLASVESILEEILKHVSKGSKDSELEKGLNWDVWIVLLTNILANAGLSTRVRKDAGDLERNSPFVIFVKELQSRLPRNLVSTRNDNDLALATAITRARKRLNWSKLSNEQIDGVLKMLLGAFKPVLGYENGDYLYGEIDPRMDENISKFLRAGDE